MPPPFDAALAAAVKEQEEKTKEKAPYFGASTRDEALELAAWKEIGKAWNNRAPHTCWKAFVARYPLVDGAATYGIVWYKACTGTQALLSAFPFVASFPLHGALLARIHASDHHRTRSASFNRCISHPCSRGAASALDAASGARANAVERRRRRRHTNEKE